MDRFTQFTTHPAVRKLAARLPLPIKLPTPARRGVETDSQRPLLDRNILLSTFSPESAAIVSALAGAGANFRLVGTPDHVHGAAELARLAGSGTHTTRVDEGDSSALQKALESTDSIDGVILDVDKLGGPKALYALLHPILEKIAPHARLLLLSRLGASPSASEEAASEGVFGFVKSLAREVGRKAITVNAVEIHAGCSADDVASVLTFLASDRACYVTSQKIRLTAKRTSEPSKSLRLDAPSHVLVTGAARGIGAATARVLARQGAHVSLIDLPGAQEAASEVVDTIVKQGGRAQFIAADVTQDTAIIELQKHAAHFGPITALVNNAGITRDRTLAKLSQSHWNQVIEVNYEAAVKLTDAVVQGRKDNKQPLSVVFLSSVAGIAGNFGQTNYTLSKAALIGHTRGLSRTLASANVRVNAVAPGFIDTVLTREIPLLNREIGKQMTCLLQAGEPEDVAEVITFLVSPAASTLNGEVIRVDGGMFLGA